MIFDAAPWRDDLSRVCDQLERRASQQRWTGRTFFLVERDIMLGAFITRKLMDSYKVTDTAMERTYEIERARLVGRPATYLTAWDPSKDYDLAGLQPDHATPREVTNQIIHSLVFGFRAKQGRVRGLDGIFVGSDYAKKSQIYYLSMVVITRMFRDVADAVPTTVEYTRHQDGQVTIALE